MWISKKTPIMGVIVSMSTGYTLLHYCSVDCNKSN